MAGNILDKILQTKRKEVAALRDAGDAEFWKARAVEAGRPRNFFAAVTKRPRNLLNLIAEVKKASPSAGVIRDDFDPAVIARSYADAGADALSVLTDREYFQGDLDYLRAAREATDLPVLRKDFIIDPLQVYEARWAGADAILLIAAAMPPGELLDLMILATELRMTVLVEVHGADELMRIRSMVGFPLPSYGLLGINNRDLTTFKVDLNTTLRLAELTDDTPLVSESGIRSREDVMRLKRAGVSAILVGETFMRSGDIASAVRELVGIGV
ncbi:MAG: indole-3-glycerol phosphate synthase TrpC [Phycisphaerae bacterium]